VGEESIDDQIYRITFDGSVTDEPGFVAFGGQADQVSAALKDRYSEGMSLAEAFAAALDALTATSNGEHTELSANQLEVAILDRTRDHRTFRRLRAARLEELIGESRAHRSSAGEESGTSGDAGSAPPATPRPDQSGPATGPDPSGTDRGSGSPL
jgi:proteasome alpha subunit